MMAAEVWVPNVVCTLVGFILGWGVSYLYAMRSTREMERQRQMLATLLITAEEQGHVQLARDPGGAITGGRLIKLAGSADGASTVIAELTTGESSVQGSGTVTKSQ